MDNESCMDWVFLRIRSGHIIAWRVCPANYEHLVRLDDMGSVLYNILTIAIYSFFGNNCIIWGHFCEKQTVGCGKNIPSLTLGHFSPAITLRKAPWKKKPLRRFFWCKHLRDSPPERRMYDCVAGSRSVTAIFLTNEQLTFQIAPYPLPKPFTLKQ